jgi:hypothetical protein
LTRLATPSRLIDEARDAQQTEAVNKRMLLAAAAVLVVVFILLPVVGSEIGVGFYALLINFAAVLALLALATWVVATVWKAVMRR